MSEENSVQIKKVNAYPFDVFLTKDGAPKRTQALKLVGHGMILDLLEHMLVVGQRYTASMTLPADFGSITTEVKVIKTYDTPQGAKVQRMAEIHFLPYPLPERDRLIVKEFLKALREAGAK